MAFCWRVGCSIGEGYWEEEDWLGTGSAAAIKDRERELCLNGLGFASLRDALLRLEKEPSNESLQLSP